MSEPNRTAEIGASVAAMFVAAGGFLVVVLIIAIVIEMGFEQPVPAPVYVIIGIVLLAIFAFYGLNILTLIKTNQVTVKKTVEYRNAELEAMTALTIAQAMNVPPTTGYMEAKPPLVRQKTLRKRVPQIAPSGTYPALEHDDDDDSEPLALPDNVIRLERDDDDIA